MLALSHAAGVSAPDALLEPIPEHQKLVPPRHAVAEVHAVPQHHRPDALRHEVPGKRAPAGVQHGLLTTQGRERS